MRFEVCWLQHSHRSGSDQLLIVGSDGATGSVALIVTGPDGQPLAVGAAPGAGALRIVPLAKQTAEFKITLTAIGGDGRAVALNRSDWLFTPKPTEPTQPSAVGHGYLLLVRAAVATQPWRAIVYDGPAPADPTSLLTLPDWPTDRTLVFSVERTAGSASSRSYPLAQLHPVAAIAGTCQMTWDIAPSVSLGSDANDVPIEGAIHRQHPDFKPGSAITRLSLKLTLNAPFPALADRRQPSAPGDPTGVALVRLSRQAIAARCHGQAATVTYFNSSADPHHTETAFRRGATDRTADVLFDQPARGDILLLRGLPSPYHLTVHLPKGDTYEVTDRDWATVVVEEVAGTAGGLALTRFDEAKLANWKNQGRVTPEFATAVGVSCAQAQAASPVHTVTVQASDIAASATCLSDGATATVAARPLSNAEAVSGLLRVLENQSSSPDGIRAGDINTVLTALAISPVSIAALTARPFAQTLAAAHLLSRLTREQSPADTATTAQDALEPMRSPIRLAWLEGLPPDTTRDTILARLRDMTTDDNDRVTAHPIDLPDLHAWSDAQRATLANLDTQFDAAKAFLLGLPPYARPVAARPPVFASADAETKRSAITAHAHKIAAGDSTTARRGGNLPPIVTLPAVLDWFHDACNRAGKLSDWRQRQLHDAHWPSLPLHSRRNRKPDAESRRSLADNIWVELTRDAYSAKIDESEQLNRYDRYWQAYARMAACGTAETDALTAVVATLEAHLRAEFESLLAIWDGTDARLTAHWRGALPNSRVARDNRLAVLALSRAMLVVHRETKLWAAEVLARVPAQDKRNIQNLAYERRLAWVGGAQSRSVDDLNGDDGLAHFITEIAALDQVRPDDTPLPP